MPKNTLSKEEAQQVAFSSYQRKDLVAFLVGSSVVVSIVTTLYVGIAFSMKRSGKNVGEMIKSIPIEWLTLVSSIAYGLVSLAIKKIVMDRPQVNVNWILLIGAITGLLFSVAGRFVMDMPRVLFGMQSNEEWKVHLGAPILYSIVFRFYVYPILTWALGY